MVRRLKDLRVARSTLERKIVKKYNFVLKAKHFLVLEGYDPRIHAVFFCPQLYKYDPEKKLVPLEGDEIGRLIAHAVEGGITERRPWYDPSEKLPDRPIIDAEMNVEFETLIVDVPSAQNGCREEFERRGQHWNARSGRLAAAVNHKADEQSTSPPCDKLLSSFSHRRGPCREGTLRRRRGPPLTPSPFLLTT